HRETIFIQSCLDQRSPTFLGEQNAIRVEKHIGTTLLEIANHQRQLFIEQRLSKSMQDNPIQSRELVNDLAKFFKAQITIILAREQGARTLLAKFVAAAGWFNIN